MSDIDHQAAIDRAKRIIDILGGVAEVCRITGKSRTRVYSWTYPRDRGGSAGMIPMNCQIVMVEHARKANLPLAPEDFFPEPSSADEAAA